MPILSKDNKKESRATGQLPHRQLFKPENTIEGIFVGLSICSVLVLILSNIVNIDSSIKTIVPEFIRRNFPQIMHILHICLIIYVLLEMRRMYEDIREIRPYKDDIKKKNGQDTYLKRWQQWIEENIDFLRSEKNEYGCYNKTTKTEQEYVNRINYRIKVTNANMKATHTLWICVWATWLLMYIGMFTSGFMEQTLVQPNEKSRKIETGIILKDSILSTTYQVKDIVRGRTDSINTVLRIVSSVDTVIPLVNAYETTRIPKDGEKTLFSKFRNDSLTLGYVVTKKIDNKPINNKDYDQEKRKLKKLFMFTEDALGHIVNFFMFLMFFMYQFPYSGTMAFPELKRREEEEKWKEKWRKIKSIRRSLKLARRKNLIEKNILSWFILVLVNSLLFKLAGGLYYLKNRFGSIDLTKEKIINDNHLKEELKNTVFFILYFIIVLIVTIAIICIDYCWIFIADDKKFYAQLLVSALTCISMMFLFGQLNNGKLRLPGMAVVVMFFYAAIQLFSPFRDREIMQSVGFLNAETFGFVVTTLCFIAKFMVFFIIRWMFTGGRFAYCSLDRAIHDHPEVIITNNKKRDDNLYLAIFNS
ncbi:hypothetical protein FACS1894177_03410 [Bacteroidia bacterium]|nr:hypothetical protein FACS1894177_03410 [Bacteroidia bacterium]